jgi:protein involved in temperature-dependent protein secretion
MGSRLTCPLTYPAAAACQHVASLHPNALSPGRVYRQLLDSAAAVSSCQLVAGLTRSSLPPTGQTGAAAACQHVASLRPDAFLPGRVYRQLLACAAVRSCKLVAALRPDAFSPGRVHRHWLAGALFGQTGRTQSYAAQATANLEQTACQLVAALRPDAFLPGRVHRHLLGHQNHVAALRPDGF